MVNCKTCSRVTFLDTEYCREHYSKLHKLKGEIPKYKERAWRDYLQYTLLQDWCIHLEYDKQLSGTSIKPDLHFFFLGVLFVIEIDEFQHKLNIAYEKERDEKRYENLKLFKKVHFIRINTDKNSRREGIFNRTSKISADDHTIQVSMEINKKEFDYRKKVVDEFLNYLLTSECDDYGKNINYFGDFSSKLKIYKLFYD